MQAFSSTPAALGDMDEYKFDAVHVEQSDADNAMFERLDDAGSARCRTERTTSSISHAIQPPIVCAFWLTVWPAPALTPRLSSRHWPLLTA